MASKCGNKEKDKEVEDRKIEKQKMRWTMSNKKQLMMEFIMPVMAEHATFRQPDVIRAVHNQFTR